MSSQSEFLKSCIALVAWRWGAQFGPRGPVMIAQCLSNRVKRGWGSWSQVLNDMNNFSFLPVGEEPQGFPDPWDPSFTRLLVEIEKIYNGIDEDLTCGSLFWCDLSNVKREWFLSNIVRNPAEHGSGASYGLLTFYV